MKQLNFIFKTAIMLTMVSAFIMLDSNLKAQCNGTCAGYGTYSHNYLTAGGNDAERNCENNAEGDCSFALGTRCVTTANADFSIAAGIQTSVDAVAAYAFGTQVNIGATADQSFVLGSGLTNNTPESFLLGWNGDPLFYGEAATERVGIRQTNPTATLHVEGISTANTDFALRVTDGAGNDIMLVRNDGKVAVGQQGPYFWGHDFEVRDDAAKLGGGNWSNLSDKRLKKDINNYTHGLEEVLKIRPVTYYYNGKLGLPAEEQQIGVIAQEIKSIAPYMVELKQTSSGEAYYSYNSSAIKYMLINAIKEQQQTITAQNDKIVQYEARISNLESKMDKFLRASSNDNETDISNNGNVKNVSISNVSIEEPMLFQNEPNPFSGSTTIRYYVPEKVTNAEIIIISTENGQVLKRVAINEKGMGTLNLNVERVASGNYTYTLILDGQQSLSRQMMVGR